MKGFWNYDGEYTRTAGKLFDTLLLGLVWLLCCLPVVTAGAACCALYYALVKSVRGERGYALREYWHGFRVNWKTASAGWLASLFVSGIAVWNLRIIDRMEVSDFTAFLLVLNILVLLALAAVSVCYYPVVSRFEGNFGRELCISAYLAVRHLGTALLCLLILAMGGVLVWRVPVLILLLPGPLCLLISEFMEKVLQFTPPTSEQ